MARLAYSLETLRDEINARWPGRNKASDGWLGDADHAATASDHNPNAEGVVCAYDFTNDPASGADMGQVAEILRRLRHPDLKYVIEHFSRRIFSSYDHNGIPAFTWRDYSGPAANELHVSVGRGGDGQSVQPYDDRVSWFNGAPTPEPEPEPERIAPPFVWSVRAPMMRGESIGWAQRVLILGCGQYLGQSGADGIYGPLTADGIENVQRFFHIGVDRKVGPQTWGVLELIGSLHAIT